MFFPALSAVFKEQIFSNAKEKLGGKDLDLFAVNSFGSAAQAGCVFLLLPVISSLRGISFTDLPQYLSDGMRCRLILCLLRLSKICAAISAMHRKLHAHKKEFIQL